MDMCASVVLSHAPIAEFTNLFNENLFAEFCTVLFKQDPSDANLNFAQQIIEKLLVTDFSAVDMRIEEMGHVYGLLGFNHGSITSN